MYEPVNSVPCIIIHLKLMEISMSNLGIDAKNMCPVLNVK